MSQISSGEVKRVDYVIGVDCGVSTGLAVWNCKTKCFDYIRTVMIHQAFDFVLDYHGNSKIKVRVEDARQVRFKTEAKKAKGAGSVCRDAKAWEDFLKDHDIPFEMVRPNKQITNWTAEQFQQRTGYAKSTSTHSRDAGMLCFNY